MKSIKSFTLPPNSSATEFLTSENAPPAILVCGGSGFSRERDCAAFSRLGRRGLGFKITGRDRKIKT